MDANQSSVVRQPSVVEQPFPYCEKCDHVLRQWYRPLGTILTDSTFPPPLSQNEVKLSDYEPTYLELSAQSCRHCNFILQVLNSSPWMPLSDYDCIKVRLDWVGSATWNISSGVDKEVDREKYYMPKIQRFKRGSSDDYTSDFTHILPLIKREQQTGGNSYSGGFFGRIVGTTVDFGLVRLWFDMCCRQHLPINVRSRIRPISNRKGCCPAPSQLIPHFRLIDVVNQCVITPEPLAQYAALSYAWGTAKRLLLCADNLLQYSTPGALGMSNPDVPTTFKDTLVVATELGIRYIWIDALCILQDDELQLQEHMNRMDFIYSSAVLTIVSDTDNANSGIPGISLPRGPPQATFRYNNTLYISSKRMLVRSMAESPWEKRAWCFQEKVFSKRLLIFSPSQAFYHCQSATYSEDRILEINQDTKRDMSTGSKVSHGRLDSFKFSIWYTFGNSHLPHDIFSLLQLLEYYSQRHLSFEGDSIRAFQGVLNFMEARVGLAIWGIPRLWFKDVMTWRMNYNPALRRAQFPSWSWAGWRGDLGSHVEFQLDTSYDKPRDDEDMWPINWMYYQWDKTKLEYELVPLKKRVTRAQIEREDPWYLPSHPGSPTYQPNPAFPPLFSPSDARLSQVIRFYTSTTTLFIDSVEVFPVDVSAPDCMADYAVRNPKTRKLLCLASLPSSWSGLGKMHTFIYIKYARNYPDRPWDNIYLMLVEGEGEIKERVTIVGTVKLHHWKALNPKWELVNLA